MLVIGAAISLMLAWKLLWGRIDLDDAVKR